MRTRFLQPLRDLRAFPRQFWILIIGTFIYVAAAALAFPYEGIFLSRVLGVSLTWIGVLFGVVPLVMMPLQIWGGALTDRLGRRRMMILSAWMGVAWFVGFAFVRTVWQVALLVALESAFGWPLFQTASGAMIADLLPASKRAEAYSVYRAVMNLGVVVGPALAGLALGAGVTFRGLFLSAAAGCFAFTLLIIWGVRETRPAAVHGTEGKRAPGEPVAEEAGYRRVLADRHFLVFCAVATLPVFCFGTFGAIYSVFITTVLHVPYATWGLLLALNALVIAVLQYPLVRALRHADRLILLSLASTLVGLSLGLSAFVHGVWPLVILIVVLSFGEMLLSPFASAVVADLAPEALRGRYMGAWTVVWNGGAALGPAVTGVTMDAIGGRETFMVVLAVGVAGALLFLALRRSVQHSGERAAYMVAAPGSDAHRT